MNRMPEKCDPFIYYNRVRPYIFGWKNNPTTPEGVVYEGVEEYENTPQIFRGETGAQSSIVPMLDALLGVTKEHLDKLKELKEDLQKGVMTQEEFNKKLKELNEKKSQIVNKFFALIPENIRGFDGDFGVKCDEWKGKMTWQYIKTKIKNS